MHTAFAEPLRSRAAADLSVSRVTRLGTGDVYRGPPHYRADGNPRVG
jgi:hypothetical protein